MTACGHCSEISPKFFISLMSEFIAARAINSPLYLFVSAVTDTILIKILSVICDRDRQAKVVLSNFLILVVL